MPSKSGKTDTKKRADKKTKKKTSLLRKLIRFVLVSMLVLCLLGCGTVALVFWYYSRSLPGIFSYDDYQPKQMSVITDKDGRPILELYEEKRTVIPFSEIPQTMKDAMIAAEDASFYSHKGLDYIGIVRAVIVNIQRGGFSQGSSTITQQVVKNLLLTPEKQMSRKIQEVLLARQIEQALTKDEILAIYLNHVYFGHRNYGIEQAALYYYGIHASELSLDQAATLAGLVQSPERLSPQKHPERALERRNYVIKQMFDKGLITQDARDEALALPIKLNRKSAETIGAAPYFAEHVRQMLISEYGGKDYVYTAGMTVTTTLDLEAQRMAEEAFKKGLFAVDERHYMNRPLKNPSKKKPTKFEKEKNFEAPIAKIDGDTVYFEIGGQTLPYTPTMRQRKEGPIEETFKVGQTWFIQIDDLDAKGVPQKIHIPSGPNGGMIAIDPATHDVVALVGGYSYKDSVFNRATQAMRQTGSSFKTFVYGAALEARVITPTTIIDDAPKVFHIPGQKKPWSAKNSDNKFKGPMTVRAALAQSRNTIAVDVLERTGIDKTIAFVRKFGINSPLVENYTLALGSSSMNVLDVTNAYATIAAGGQYKSPRFIKEIRRAGQTIPLHPQESHRAIDPDVAYVLSSMLKSVATEGTARKHLGKWKRDVAGKTGTTNSTKDAWFVGFTTRLACGVYIGYDDPVTLGKGEGGSSTAAPIFADFMGEYHRDLPEESFVKPDSVIQLEVDAATGLLPSTEKNRRKEVFLSGTQPVTTAPLQEESNAQDWMMRQLSVPSDEPIDDVGSEDEF
ncbi:MAG: PBP1A family penicillin-binding protein [Proteobacteria bacterium]|nr:PBP1A family penicillin-binding protein [Pseudomonadota bacterium]